MWSVQSNLLTRHERYLTEKEEQAKLVSHMLLLCADGVTLNGMRIALDFHSHMQVLSDAK